VFDVISSLENSIIIGLSLGHFRWGSKFQWNRTILLAESHKLASHPLDERPWPKSGKFSRLNLHGTILEGNSIGSDQKEWPKTKEKGAQMKACDWENQDGRALGSKTKKWQIEAKLT